MRSGGRATIDFSFFETEFEHDTLKIYDGDDDGTTPAIKLSGAKPESLVWRSEHATVFAVFRADAEYRSNVETEQRGFAATWFDSTDGATCAEDCNGHGTCVDGLCDCAGGFGPDDLTDCSIPVFPLVDGVAAKIEHLGVGEWAYFSFDIPADHSFLVEVLDRSTADADPRLRVKLGGLPTRSDFDFADWFDWYYDCSDLHHVRDSGMLPNGWAGGKGYVGVVNDRTRGAAPLSADVTVRVSSPGEVACLQDCNGHGTCDIAYGSCECDDGWEGSFVNWPDNCRFEVRDLELGTSYASQLRIGNWDYYTFTVGDNMAHTKSLFLEFYSTSPLSYPIFLARRGSPPRLEEGWLLCGIPTDSRYLQRECSGTNFWGLSL